MADRISVYKEDVRTIEDIRKYVNAARDIIADARVYIRANVLYDATTDNLIFCHGWELVHAIGYKTVSIDVDGKIKPCKLFSKYDSSMPKNDTLDLKIEY